MGIDLTKRYESSDDFFTLSGSIMMKLSTNAAIEVCERCVQFDLLVARVEGGIWHFPGFEARSDCIWDGLDSPVDRSVAEWNNKKAIDLIPCESVIHDSFIVTTFEINEINDEPKIKILLW